MDNKLQELQEEAMHMQVGLLDNYANS